MASEKNEAESPEPPVQLPTPDKENTEWFTRSADPDIKKIVKGD